MTRADGEATVNSLAVKFFNNKVEIRDNPGHNNDSGHAEQIIEQSLLTREVSKKGGQSSEVQVG
eukprot:UN15884